MPIIVTPVRNSRTSGIVRSAAAPRSSSPGARRSIARSSVAASRCSVAATASSSPGATRSAASTRLVSATSAKRSSSISSPGASFCAARANGDPPRSVRRCASAVGMRSAGAVRASAASVARSARRLALADAHAGEVELAVDLERLVVVGEAEVGHAPALPAVRGLLQLGVELARRGDQQPARQVLVRAVERIDQPDDDRGAVVLARRRPAARRPRPGGRPRPARRSRRASGRRSLAAPPAAAPASGRRCARPRRRISADQLGVQAGQPARRCARAARAPSPRPTRRARRGRSGRAARARSRARPEAARPSPPPSIGPRVLVAELVQHVVELVAGQRANGRLEVALGEQRVGAAQAAAAPQLGAERRQRDDVGGRLSGLDCMRGGP